VRDVPALATAPAATAPAHSFRSALLQMTEPIVQRIRTEVPAYAGPSGGRRHQLMSTAATAAIRAYLDTSPQSASSRRKVDELFHRMGWGEAQSGHGSDNLEAAISVAARAGWEHLADFAVAKQMSARALRDVTLALNEYTEHLRSELLRGHAMGLRRPAVDPSRARQRLFQLLPSAAVGRVSPSAPLGVDEQLLTQVAAEAGWSVPEEVVALAVSFHGPAPELPDDPSVVHRVDGQRMRIVCPAATAVELVRHIERSGSDRRVVHSWAVPTAEAGSAMLWSTRALDLVQLGVIAPTAVVRCEDHVTQLWLHAEPSMRRRLCQSLLEPLLGETPNSREILSETLLVWLETRDSAPAIAARLEVHPQTVRYRWRRINELFGELLSDPEFVVLVTLVLKASVPMWKGGDQKDFDLFRENREDQR